VSEVLAYCQMFRVEGTDERETLMKFVRVMDSAFRKVMREKAAKTDTKTKP
jgi:hypothetical protein